MNLSLPVKRLIELANNHECDVYDHDQECTICAEIATLEAALAQQAQPEVVSLRVEAVADDLEIVGAALALAGNFGASDTCKRAVAALRDKSP